MHQTLDAAVDADTNLVWLQILANSKYDSCKGHFENKPAQGEANSDVPDILIRFQEGSDGSAGPRL